MLRASPITAMLGAIFVFGLGNGKDKLLILENFLRTEGHTVQNVAPPTSRDVLDLGPGLVQRLYCIGERIGEGYSPSVDIK